MKIKREENYYDAYKIAVHQLKKTVEEKNLWKKTSIFFMFISCFLLGTLITILKYI